MNSTRTEYDTTDGLIALFGDLHTKRTTARVQVKSTSVTAHVDFVDGEITGARYHHHVGADAFERACRLTSGDVEFVQLSATSQPLGQFSELVNNAGTFGRALRERASRVGGFQRVWDVHFANLRKSLSKLPAEVTPILRLIDGRRTVAEIIETSAQSEELVLRVLERFKNMNLLKAGAQRPTAKPLLVDLSAAHRFFQAPQASTSTMLVDDELMIPMHDSVLPIPADINVPQMIDFPALTADVGTSRGELMPLETAVQNEGNPTMDEKRIGAQKQGARATPSPMDARRPEPQVKPAAPVQGRQSSQTIGPKPFGRAPIETLRADQLPTRTDNYSNLVEKTLRAPNRPSAGTEVERGFFSTMTLEDVSGIGRTTGTNFGATMAMILAGLVAAFCVYAFIALVPPPKLDTAEALAQYTEAMTQLDDGNPNASCELLSDLKKRIRTDSVIYRRAYNKFHEMCD